MKLLKFILAGLLLIILAEDGLSQYAYKNGKQELVRRQDFMKLAGWNFAPGITWMGTRIRNTRDLLYQSGDTSYHSIQDPGGRIGLYLEVGRHRIFRYFKLFPYMDYGIAYKSLRGKESYEGEWTTNTQEEPFSLTEGSGKFAHHNVAVYINFNNILQMTDKLFIQNSLGANVDYSFIKRSDDIAEPFRTNAELPELWGQLHYKLGFGIKIHDGFFIIPAIETPILNIRPWTDFQLKVNKFMSTYRPLILSVRFAFIGQKYVDCPPVYDPANQNTDDPDFK